MIDIQKRKIHIKEIVPYMHACFTPSQTKTFDVFITPHSCTCPLKSLCRLNSNDNTAQEGCECFVVCWAEVCGGYSVFFQNCEYGCELLTCKSTWFWENQLRTTGNLLRKKAPCKSWSSEEDMAHIREEFRWNLCESICVASTRLQSSHLLYMMLCTYTSI